MKSARNKEMSGKLRQISVSSDPDDRTNEYIELERKQYENEALKEISVRSDPDDRTNKYIEGEQKKHEIDVIRIKNKKKKSEIREINQNIVERRKYASKIFYFVRSWAIGTFFLLILQGFFSPLGWFTISDEILLAVIAGTTINITGLFVIVVKYLFPSMKVKKSAIQGPKIDS